ncbi:cytoskeleton assembly control protein SLA1 [Sodiomyces alkalinus F11]|uniref:Actin cytoskeleton-regulatory complex protein SLA1 n=1 Tax=Sodiomyces alkalinus (strain CBS 110278 / VKM F-3762 / F11) TaxID=1314773 RepID=A0A3N2PRI9_SODAK|nr:cytoskeleton assembly control protein SLA1 [Sodiomyces alkalinus F11]ROT37044.1 cytoskeleton assembly control protein SLA1 [Sodiomyces alkalinus F11]
MGFQGIYRAIYDYAPQADGELSITEGDLLYILDKNFDDGWWRAKKKANAEDGDEPVGLVPNNYVEEAQPMTRARALYEYTRQTDEELSFPEDANLTVYDASDEDWILVGLGDDFGFVPANYIEIQDAENGKSAAVQPMPPSLPTRPMPVAAEPGHPYEPSAGTSVSPPFIPASSATEDPAAALASVIHARSLRRESTQAAPSPQSSEFRVSNEGDDKNRRTPQLPARPASETTSSQAGDEPRRHPHVADGVEVESPPPRVPGGFHMYNINEMVSIMGKRKKMPTTLGINLGTGTILIAPERTQDGPTQEWTADKMTHYSREGKHVFLELVKPSKSVDFHAGAKDTAEEIVGALGELAGAVKAQGLREVILAGSSHHQKKGQVLYDFMAQGDDEVTVAVGDGVIILDDNKSEEWWQVRRLKNGKEGVVPSSYIEVTGTVSPPSSSGLNAGLSVVEQNRQEEIRLTKEAMKAGQRDGQEIQVGPGMPLPDRGSSLLAQERGNNSGQRSKRETGQLGSNNSRKSRPDVEKVRTWTDRSKSFSVEAQFLGLKDGKINLHKMNGVKIAVPIAKMSLPDLEYVEQLTGISLDEDKPLSNVKKVNKTSPNVIRASNIGDKIGAGASVQRPQKPEYDWFQFFLSCDVAVGLCERYAQAFSKESMDESVLPDVDAMVLRNLGLREGDILKVMRNLDAKYSRTGSRGKKIKDGIGSDDDGSTEGGLFSGPGGVLRNNTRKGRPAPAVQASDVVDAKGLATKSEDKSQPNKPAPSTDEPRNPQASGSGFDDDAWDIKPAKKVEERQKAASTESARPPASMTSSMQELSLLTAPLEPSRPQTQTQVPTQSQVPAPSQTITPENTQVAAQGSQQPGATPSFFAANSPNSSGLQQRQRPTPPQITPTQGSALIPPPAARPLSAPQSTQPSAFAPPALGPLPTGANYQARVAPPGQSMEELNQARSRQQFMGQLQQYPMAGFPGQQHAPDTHPFGVNIPQFMQPMVTGMATPQSQAPFGEPGRPSSLSPLPPQATGYPMSYSPSLPLQTHPTGNVNSFLPPALTPQQAGMPSFQPQPTGADSFKSLSALQPLQPQKTGPVPPVRFGITGEAKPLAPQPTGRRANLAQATPNNPFGF